MTFVVGLTGGIGCGKSSASQFFSDLGINVIDTDVIARQLTQPGGQAIDQIRKTFGDTFLAGNGSLDREKMRNLVFSNSDSKEELEKILHPLILNEVVRLVKKARSPYVVVVVPLLLELKDYDDLIDRVLVIDCEEQQQILRTMMRSQLSEQFVRAVMATQITREDRLQRADDIIFNNQDIAYLKMQITRMHNKYMTENNN
ncbi:dephospho-CoA kinase [Nitrosomonas sp.]|uniref:dephospho-CoA kinase n=1 Tax=Nitrosomonas sp. TaxID=42353 RepID=UPI001DDEB0EC|nr:dephospho-CoA kinase [Nitrosomonas sp.]MBX3617531.1 dephospho-CoA kinase [Nitrosomonas sp.]